MHSRSMMTVLLLAAAAMGLAGCATEPVPAKKRAAAATPATVSLSGTNGDMNRYLGAWSSGCGREVRATGAGGGVFTSGTNTFNFTSVAGKMVRGTLDVDTFDSRDCSGNPKRTTTEVVLTFVQPIPAGSAFAETTIFTGSADKVTATTPGAAGEGSTFNIGFRDNFTKFQLAPVDIFSATNLIYTKQ